MIASEAARLRRRILDADVPVDVGSATAELIDYTQHLEAQVALMLGGIDSARAALAPRIYHSPELPLRTGESVPTKRKT